MQYLVISNIIIIFNTKIFFNEALNDTTFCTTNWFFDQDRGYCVNSCEPSKTYGNPVNGYCVTDCPDPYFADNVTTVFLCNLICSGDIMFTPPRMQFGDNANRKCVLYCTPGTYADPNSRTCVPKCPNTWYGDNTTWSCVQECPDGYFADDSTNMCVLVCPP